jgi:hypothetical protein
VERTFLLSIKGFDFDLAGTIDVEEATRVRDTKTFLKRPTQDSVDRSLQLSLYALAKKTVDGTNPEELCLDVLLKQKQPKVEVFKTTRTDADYRSLLQRVELAAEQIEAGLFGPCSPDHWGCSDRFCGYWADHCEFGRRARIAA